jgi:carbohydrate-selective porin OprB
MLHKENADPEDGQGLGAFFRYGYAPSEKNDITNFYSLGLQYQGLFDGWDDDVFGLAYARGVFANRVASDYPADYESVLEGYYNAQIAPWFVFGPSIQYVANPTSGEGSTSKDAVVFGVRAQMIF